MPLSASDCVPHQMETTVATLGKFASVGRRLAENITANRQAELNDAEQREQLVASVAEVRLRSIEIEFEIEIEIEIVPR